MTPFEHLTELVAVSAGKLLVKVLARNDHVWADRKPGERGKGKQHGFYVPAEIRTSHHFPTLGQRSDKPHIFDRKVKTVWPQDGMQPPRTSNLVHYSNKGPEAHFTGLPKDLFRDLGPSSLLVMRLPDNIEDGEAVWTGVVISSGTTDYDDAYDLLGLPPGFQFDLLDIPSGHPDEELAQEIYRALVDGTLDRLVAASLLTKGLELARQTQGRLLDEIGISSFNAFDELNSPGDIILELCDRQFIEYQKLELRLRASELVKLLDDARPGITDSQETVRAVVTAFPLILELFKSLRGARASRMGTTLELHIGRVFADSGVRFTEQPKIGNRSPDFLLPSIELYNQDPLATLILTAKSTLRERWQQILNEGDAGGIYLATLDRSITDSSLADMNDAGISIVVPEKFVAKPGPGRQAGIYMGKTNVISFRSFLDGPYREFAGKWTSNVAPRLL